MKGLRALLRFALLATWLPLHWEREGSLAQAAFAQSDEDYVQEEVALSKLEAEQQPANPTFGPVPVDLVTLPERASKDALDVEAVPLPGDKKPTSGSTAKKLPFATPFLAVVFGLVLVVGALALERHVRPRGIPPELALELERALALQPDAEGLAKAVATDEAKEAYRCAEESILEAQKASKEAAVKVGRPREQAIAHMKSNLADAVSALRELHEDAKRTGVKLIETFPQFAAVPPWYEFMKSMAGENEYLASVKVVLASYESAAGLASEQGKLACEQLESSTFTSVADGRVLRQSLKDFLALQHARDEVTRLSSWSEEAQDITLKSLIDDQEIRRSAIAVTLEEKVGIAFQVCKEMMEVIKSDPPSDVNLAELDAANQRAMEDSVSMVAAHSEVVASLTRAENPMEFQSLVLKAKDLEGRLSEVAHSLWQHAENYAEFLDKKDVMLKLEVQKLMLECRLIERKADAYKQLALHRISQLQETLQNRFPGDAQEPLTRFFAGELVSKLKEEGQAIGHLIETQEQTLKGLLASTRQWAEIDDASADARVILEELDKGVGRTDRELRELIKLCQESLHMHMEAKFAATLEDYMEASTQKAEKGSSLIPEEPGPAAQEMQQLVEKFERARGIASKGASLLIVAQGAASMGTAAAKLEDTIFKYERGLS